MKGTQYTTTITYRLDAKKYAYNIFDEASLEELASYTDIDWYDTTKEILDNKFGPKWADLEEQLIYDYYSEEMIDEVVKVLLKLQKDWKASQEDS